MIIALYKILLAQVMILLKELDTPQLGNSLQIEIYCQKEMIARHHLAVMLMTPSINTALKDCFNNAGYTFDVDMTKGVGFVKLLRKTIRFTFDDVLYKQVQNFLHNEVTYGLF